MQLQSHFDRTTAVAPSGPAGQFAGTLDESWGALRGVHGGYVTALAVRAAEAAAPERAVRTVSATFLRPAHPGPIELEVSLLRNGRSLTTAVVASRQDDRDIASTRITLADPAIVGEQWATASLGRPPSRGECVPFVPQSDVVRHFGQADLLIDPATLPHGDADDARITGHVRPLEPGPIDAVWLTMVADLFPPAPFRRAQPPVGGVSIDYTVHVHRTLPADVDVWLEGVFDARTSVAGIALEHGTLALPSGELVAECFHTRWTG